MENISFGGVGRNGLASSVESNVSWYGRSSCGVKVLDPLDPGFLFVPSAPQSQMTYKGTRDSVFGIPMLGTCTLMMAFSMIEQGVE